MTPVLTASLWPLIGLAIGTDTMPTILVSVLTMSIYMCAC